MSQQTSLASNVAGESSTPQPPHAQSCHVLITELIKCVRDGRPQLPKAPEQASAGEQRSRLAWIQQHGAVEVRVGLLQKPKVYAYQRTLQP